MMEQCPTERLRRRRAAGLALAAGLGLGFGSACSDRDVFLAPGASPAESTTEPVRPSPPSSMTPADTAAPTQPTPPASDEGPGPAPSLDPPAAAEPGSGAPPTPVPPAAAPTPEPSAPPPVTPAPPLDPAQRCQPAEGTLTGLHLTEIASGLDQPTFITSAPADDTRQFVLERTGAVRILAGGQLAATPFLDLRAKVSTSNEEGLVGLAFHPDYENNGRFFVQYALLDPERQSGEDQQIVLSEFARSADDPNRADPDSERVLMLVPQPSDIHLAGMLAFGPSDGMLYISRGDGGSHDSQDPSSVLGKLLRIDVDSSSDGLPYGIPDGNMSGDGVTPELWAMGLRNPWRFSFDSCTEDLYIGDVGESSFEEIDFQPANTPGRNYGWRTLEGLACFEADSCSPTGLSEPLVTFEHDFGCSVTGGYVYRGQRIPALRGTYLYADYCFGNFASLRVEAGQAVDVQDITRDINPTDIQLITSFGTDNAGELYVLSQLGGVYRIDPD